MMEFKHKNPVTLFFGENQINNVVTEIASYETNILLILGGKSFNSNGHYLSLIQKMQEKDLLNCVLDKLFSIYKKFGISTKLKQIKEEKGDRNKLYKIVKNIGNISSQYGEFRTDDIFYMFEQSIG